MRIIVCVKQVPDAEAPIGIADDGRSFAVGAGDWRMNRFDEFAAVEKPVSFLPLLINACRRQQRYGKEAGS
jgi:electron transfer flavoprotein alpha/beta subunit